jgi:hypothetical protein
MPTLVLIGAVAGATAVAASSCGWDRFRGDVAKSYMALLRSPTNPSGFDVNSTVPPPDYANPWYLPLQVVANLTRLLEPRIGIGQTGGHGQECNCTPPAPTAAEHVACTGPLWNGPRATPVDVIDVFTIAYEMDVLQSRLAESYDLLTKIVVAESTFTHRMSRKPLFFAKKSARFARWREKLIYVVSDDAEMQQAYENRAGATKEHKDVWTNERTMRVFPWQRCAYSAHY